MAETMGNTARSAAGGQPAGGDARAWVGAFIALLEEQRRVLAELDSLSIRQRGLIALEDPAPLLALMDERQTLVDRIELLSLRMAPMRARWEESPTFDLDGRAIRDAVERVAALARAIAARDAQDQESLAQRRREIGAELAQMSGGQRAVHAYAGGAPTRGGGGGVAAFQDREA